MKKILTLLLLTAALLTSCKKEDYGAGEYYDVVYTTTNDMMTVNLSSTLPINTANLTALEVKVLDDRNIEYKIPLRNQNTYTINFIRIDGSVFRLVLTKSEKVLNLHF